MGKNIKLTLEFSCKPRSMNAAKTQYLGNVFPGKQQNQMLCTVNLI